jgi:signal transduction histidine kinase
MAENGAEIDFPDDSAVGGVRPEALSRPRYPASSADLLARMSHEMRTPLSAILGFAQLLESGTPSPTGPQKRNIDRILQAGWYLENLINMTRDLVLIESGALSLSMEPVSLAAVIGDCRAIIEPQASMRGVRVTCTPLEFPCFVAADRIRLQQVLVNLLSAAVDYGKSDTILVNCKIQHGQTIRIDITDEGHGSAPERLTRLFQAFHGFEPEAPPSEGIGTGLLLAKRLIESMGGTIGVQGHAKTKTIFSFDLNRMLVPMAAGLAATLDITINASEESAATTIPRQIT